MGRSQEEEEEGENLAQGQREEEGGLEGRLMRWAWRWTEDEPWNWRPSQVSYLSQL